MTEFHKLRCSTCKFWCELGCPRKGITYLKDPDMVIEITGCASHSNIKGIIYYDQ
jgi:hypothetical protein